MRQKLFLAHFLCIQKLHMEAGSNQRQAAPVPNTQHSGHSDQNTNNTDDNNGDSSDGEGERSN